MVDHFVQTFVGFENAEIFLNLNLFCLLKKINPV